MPDTSDLFAAALADRYRVERELDALYGGGDSVSGGQAARELARAAERPASGRSEARAVANTDLCAATLWRLSRGELGGAPQAIERLRRRGPGDSPESLTSNTVCAALLEAKLAAASGSAGAAAALDRLDALIRSGPGGQRNGPPSRSRSARRTSGPPWGSVLLVSRTS